MSVIAVDSGATKVNHQCPSLRLIPSQSGLGRQLDVHPVGWWVAWMTASRQQRPGGPRVALKQLGSRREGGGPGSDAQARRDWPRGVCSRWTVLRWKWRLSSEGQLASFNAKALCYQWWELLEGVWGGKWQNLIYLPKQNSCRGVQDELLGEQISEETDNKTDIGGV